MRRIILSLAVLLVIAGCSNQGLPRSGDTVAPNLVRPLVFKEGKAAELWVELAATTESGASRRLSFSASPSEDPIATVAFFDADGEQIGVEEIALSQRC